MEREKYIRVPKNKKAMEYYDYGIQKEEQMEEMVLSEEQYSKLDEELVRLKEMLNLVITYKTIVGFDF